MLTEVYEDWFNVSLFDKKHGFTLAELLITLGLIGSIGALTIPTLAFNYRGKVLEQQFRATYSEIREIGSRLNYERGDVGEFSIACVYGKAEVKCGAQTTDGKNLYGPGSSNASKGATMRWASEFISYLPGGGLVNEDSNPSNTQTNLKQIYRDAGSPILQPFLSSRKMTNGTHIICDNAGVWTDSKGRLWTFNGENGFVCVDVNGTAPPNRLNIDTFIFKPMSAKEMAIYIYDDNDPEHYANYSGQFVPCDLQAITDSDSNAMPGDVPGKKGKGYAKGSGSAVDWCYFNEPVENRAAMPFKNRLGEKQNSGTSARGKALTPKNDYWRDYINYR